MLVVRTDSRSVARCTVTWLLNFLRWLVGLRVRAWSSAIIILDYWFCWISLTALFRLVTFYQFTQSINQGWYDGSFGRYFWYESTRTRINNHLHIQIYFLSVLLAILKRSQIFCQYGSLALQPIDFCSLNFKYVASWTWGLVWLLCKDYRENLQALQTLRRS